MRICRAPLKIFKALFVDIESFVSKHSHLWICMALLWIHRPLLHMCRLLFQTCMSPMKICRSIFAEIDGLCVNTKASFADIWGSIANT